MAIFATRGGDRQLILPGNYVARCYKIIEIGSVQDSFNPEKFKKLVHINWELPTLLLKGGRPLAVGKLFTLSTNKKSTLCAFIENWRGKPFTDSEAEKFNVSS